MTKKIEGAPETITQAQVVAACEVLGLDPAWTRTVKMGVGYIEVTLFGCRPVKVLRDKDEVAEHVVYYDLLAESSADD
jgi:hypothetical protein